MSALLPFRQDTAFFSPSSPPLLQRLLAEAVASQTFNEREMLLLQARAQWPTEPDTHIALYKFYFVAAHYNRAEAAVWVALKLAAKMLGLHHNYRKLNVNSAAWDLRDGYERFYLFNLKALGVCRLRRGRVLAARSVLEKLLELDEHDEIGGDSFLKIAVSFFEEDT